MIRGLLIALVLIVIWHALKTLFRSAVKGYHEADREQSRLQGEEMVLDPECRTYVPKKRAVTRRIGAKLCSFCSQDCADRYELKERH